MTDKVDRRRILSGIGVAVTASLAGCNGTGNSADGGNSTDDSGSGNGDGTDSSGDESGETIEDFPDGFSEDGISDFETAFGEGSAYLSQPHIQIENEFAQMSDDRNVTETFSAQIDAEAERWLVDSETDSGEILQTQYLAEGMLYIREVQGEEDPQYQVRETEFSKSASFLVGAIERHVAGEVEFESEQTGEGLIRYTATEESYPEDHPITNVYSFNQEPMLDVVLEIDENGLPRRLSATYENEGFSQESTYSFSYEEVTVEEPEWVSEAES